MTVCAWAATVVDDPVLFRVRQALDAMYGDEIERVQFRDDPV
jgi:hypothetical protein